MPGANSRKSAMKRRRIPAPMLFLLGFVVIVLFNGLPSMDTSAQCLHSQPLCPIVTIVERIAHEIQRNR